MFESKIKQFLNANIQTKRMLIGSLNTSNNDLWRESIKNYAEKAVIYSDLEYVKKGVTLLLLYSYYKSRDSLMLLSLLLNSFKLVSKDEDFRKLLNFHDLGEGGEYILDFTKRKDTSIESMGFKESHYPEFNYKFQY